MKRRIALFALTLLAAVPPAFAIEDEATGFVVEPPAPYSAEIIQRPNYDVTVGIKSPQGKPQPIPPIVDLCVIGYKAWTSGDAMTQAQLSEKMQNGETTQPLLAELERQAEPVANQTFTQGDVVGFEFIGILRNGKADTAIFTSVLDTPGGRTVMTCPILVNTVAAARADLRAIRAGISAP